MESKHYTPDISEFFVGFEYERLYQDNDILSSWEKEVMSINFLSLDDIDSEIRQEEIRVKYLDESDVLSLGFELQEYKSNDYPVYRKGLVCLTTILEDIIIYSMETGSKYFRGEIKNKSELVKILKMLRIQNGE